jgi:hypothetical protein
MSHEHYSFFPLNVQCLEDKWNLKEFYMCRRGMQTMEMEATPRLGPSLRSVFN